MITNMLRHPARELVLFGVSQDCGDVGGDVVMWWPQELMFFVVVVRWCQHPARELVLFAV